MFLRKRSPMMSMMQSLYDLPTPCNISIWWNFGSLLGVCMVMQIVTGFFLSMHYVACTDTAFNSIHCLMRNVQWGWLLRYTHVNGASIFFLCTYMHISRGLYYGSYSNLGVWFLGVILFVLSMGTAFLGYVLPWGQMSYWAATVITNLLTAIPFVGEQVATWMWGGWVVGAPTLVRFYSLHYILPFLMAAIAVVHISLLHVKGSNNPLGVPINSEVIPFHPYYTIKDLVGVLFLAWGFFIIVFFDPAMFLEATNYLPSDSMHTPREITPEWYFLFAYTVLRVIPSKLGGVLVMAFSIFMLFFVPLIMRSYFLSLSFYPVSQFMYWLFNSSFVLLSWLGAYNTKFPFDKLGMCMCAMYFSCFIIATVFNMMWDKLVFFDNSFSKKSDGKFGGK